MSTGASAEVRLPGRIVKKAIESLTPYARNARTHSEEQVRELAASIKEFGWTTPVLITGAGEIIAGHGRVLAAQNLGLPKVPCIVADHLSEAQRRAYVLADNQLALNAGWDQDLLAEELRALQAEDFDLELTGFDDRELAEMLMPELDDEADGKPANAKESAAPPPPAIPVTAAGDIWQLGRHRVMCGDSTSEAQIQCLLDGKVPDLVCTDPPYCSGGFQEAGKSAGSVGTGAVHKQVANDTLSTRGYTRLLAAAFANCGASFLYAFTDWRMWVHLFDVAETAGFGVRSMIVWDKGTPGMGRGWRAQHELVLWACKKTPPFDKHASGVGNVIQAKRTGNKHHTTEKPVELMAALLRNVPFVKAAVDPFNGSGTTLMACEQVGVAGYGMELDPLYVDVTVRRWQQFTGRQAKLVATGETYAEAAASRGVELAE